MPAGFCFFFFFLETVYMAKILQQEKWSENFPFICIPFSRALWPTVCSIHRESALNYCGTSNAGGKYKPQAKGKYALHWLWPRGMGCLQITSYLYIFLGIELCPTAQRSYLGGFSRPRRGCPSKGTRRDKEPVQSGHWAAFERPTNSSWQDGTLRREITTKGWCWSAQHTLRVTLSCPNKGFSSQQRGTKPLPPESSLTPQPPSPAGLHPVPETNPKLTNKICFFPGLLISWQGKVNLCLGNKAFFSPFPAFP